MRIKLFYIWAFACIVLSSCKEKEVPVTELNNVSVIYCSPLRFDESLPLSIVKYGNNWEAVYGNPNEKDGIPLKLRYGKTDSKYSKSFVFDEYANGKLSGSYQVPKDYQWDDDDDIWECMYIDAEGKKKTKYITTTIHEGDIFINPWNVEYAFKLISDFHEGGDTSFPDRGALNLSYLLHNNPEGALDYNNFPKDEDASLHVTTSKDGKVRTYITYYITGNGHGAFQTYAAIQYKGEKEVFVLDYFDSLCYGYLKEFDGANFADCRLDIPIYEAHLGGKTFYLIEIAFHDEVPVEFENTDHIFKSDACALFAFSIEKGKLMPAKIMDGKSMIEIVAEESATPLQFKYDDKSKELSIPIIKDYSFEGAYRKIKLTKK